MNSKVNTLGITMPEDTKFSSGIGYIALPSDIDRNSYINDCYRNFRVSVHTSHDGFMNRVQISQEDLNLIDFPEDYRSLGSPVYYINDPISNQPFIIKIYKNKKKLGTGKEHEFKIGKSKASSFVEISGNPDKGYLNLIVNNDLNSELNLIVNNKNDKGKLNLSIKGDVTVTTTGNNNFMQNGLFHSKTVDPTNEISYSEIIQSSTDITQISDTSSINSDSSHEINSDLITINAQTEHDINAPLVKINSGTENLILGQKFKSFANDLIQEIGNSSVVTMLGISPLLNSVQILSYQQRVDEFLSQVGYIDK